MNTNHLLGQLIRILHEKAKRAQLYKVKLNQKKKLIEHFHFYIVELSSKSYIINSSD
jgi:hypothetical protein